MPNLKLTKIIEELVYELEDIRDWHKEENCMLRTQELSSIEEKIKLGRSALKNDYR